MSRYLAPVGFALAAVYLFVLGGLPQQPAFIKLFVCVVVAYGGFYAPILYVNNRATKRKQSIQLAWATDLGKAMNEDEAGLRARAKALVAEKGELSAKSVFARLVSPPSVVPEATPIPVQAAHALKAGGQKIGSVRFDAIGRPTVRLSVKLSSTQQEGLLKAMQGFVDSL